MKIVARLLYYAAKIAVLCHCEEWSNEAIFLRLPRPDKLGLAMTI
jgi:hypothetical protein